MGEYVCSFVGAVGSAYCGRRAITVKKTNFASIKAPEKIVFAYVHKIGNIFFKCALDDYYSASSYLWNPHSKFLFFES
jgi:hypothetical protein